MRQPPRKRLVTKNPPNIAKPQSNAKPLTTRFRIRLYDEIRQNKTNNIQQRRIKLRQTKTKNDMETPEPTDQADNSSQLPPPSDLPRL
jgi:hypothetical protein